MCILVFNFTRSIVPSSSNPNYMVTSSFNLQESVSSLVSQGTQLDSRTSLILPTTYEDPTALKP